MQVVVQPASTAASDSAAAVALWQHMGSQIQSSRRVHDAEAPDHRTHAQRTGTTSGLVERNAGECVGC